MNTALIALIQNDLRLFFADRRAVAITVIVPLMIASFFGMIFGGEDGTTPRSAIEVLLIDKDKSKVSQEIVANLQKDTALKVEVTTEADARDRITGGKAPVALIIPENLGKDAGSAMFAGPDAKRPDVLILYDPSHGAEYQMVRGLVLQQVMQVVSRSAFSPEIAGANADAQIKAIAADATMSASEKSSLTDLLSSVKRYSQRPNASESTAEGTSVGGLQMPVNLTDEAIAGKTEAKNVSVAHSFIGMAVQGVLFFALDAAIGMLRDRRSGIWKRLRAAPVSRAALLGGKILSTALIAFVILGIIFSFGMLVFHLRIDGSLLGFVLLMACTALTIATFGLLIAALGRTEAQSRGYAVPAVLAMSFLGGAWFPSFMMPEWVQNVAKAIPSSWSISGFDAVTWRGLGLDAVLLPCLALLGFAALFGTIAAMRFRWDE